MQLHVPDTNQYSPIVKRLMVWAIVLSVPTIAVFSFSQTAHAGLFSFMSSLLGGDQVSAETNQANADLEANGINSQNMSLPSVAVNQNPIADSGEAVPIGNDGETLLPDVAAANATSTDVNTQISVYTVRPGDTISGVAQMFGVSINTVLWGNNLTGRSVLRTGQTLTILPISGITYTVKKGDTVASIAKTYDADQGDIMSYNDITASTKLLAGQTIIIPDAEPSSEEIANNAQPSGSRKPTGNVSSYEPLLDHYTASFPGYYSCPILPGVGHLSQGLHGHNAVDLAAPIGTPIHAAHDGTVIIAKTGGWNGGYGNFVVISHTNDTQTLYAHMLRLIVSPGDTVSRGQTIGYIGMTGLTTGPHVHFEVRGAQNPCLYY